MRPSQVPAASEQYPIRAAEVQSGRGEPELRMHDIWWVLRYSRWIIAACVLAAIGAAFGLLAITTPQYAGSTSLRIDTKTPNLPEVMLAVDPATETEMDELRSRSLALATVEQLNMRVAMVEPSRVARAALFSTVSVAADAPPADYVMQREADSSFALTDGAGDSLGRLRAGQPAVFRGITLVMTPAARAFPRIAFQVLKADDAAGALQQATTVDRAGRESQIVTVGYRSADPDLAWRVPNAIVGAFMARRQGLQHSDTRSMVSFLREQLDTVNGQLTTAEDKLQRFREVEGVVSPETDANSQVSRLVSLQAERGSLDAERQALAELVAQARAAADSARPADAPSPYRRLMAFPTLLKSRTTLDVSSTLAQLENERNELLVRRTEADPDVQALTTRIHQLEDQVGNTAVTYLQGLTSQIAAIDSTLRGFSRQLATLPQKQVQYARLDRQPKVLEQMATLLQTRLKEAEIAGAVQDASIRVVDSAVVPSHPATPRRPVYLAAAVMLGLLLGAAAAFLRAFLDTSVHSRADVQLLTGLPVVGLIPRIDTRRQRLIALVTDPKARQARARGHAHTVLLPVRRRRSGSSNSRPHTGGAASAAENASGSPHASAIAEAYSVLQTNIVHTSEGGRIRCIVFTSALPGEGKTTSAVNLALTLARRGVKALLVDADLPRGVVHRIFDLPRANGLADALQNELSVGSVRRTVDVGDARTLDVVTAGASGTGASGLLDSETMRTFIEGCRDAYDAVILDAPPVNVIADAALLGMQADGVVMVARVGVTESAALAYAIDQLRHVNAPLVGVLLNDIDFRRDAIYDATYRYCDYSQYVAAAAK